MIAPADLLSQALNLPADQRADMAQRLLESLPDDQDLPYLPDEERVQENLETFRQNMRETLIRSSQP